MTTGWLFKKPGPYGATNSKKCRSCLFIGPPQECSCAGSLHCATLCREHAKYMSELEEQALEVENRSQQDFLSTHLAILHHDPPSLKEDLHSSYNILLGNLSSSLQSVPSTRGPQAQGQPPVTTSPKSEPTQSQQPKRQNPLPDLWGDTFIDEDSPRGLHRRIHHTPRGRRPVTGSLPSSLVGWMPSAGTVVP